MAKIQGCSVIYRPAGRALEYADLAVNLFRGCNHSCAYCFAPSVLRMKKDEFHAAVTPRKDILYKLERDARVLQKQGEKRKVLLCFTCDPYPDDEQACYLTSKAADILKSFDLNIQILTKGGMRAVGLAGGLLTPDDAFATTLTFLDSRQSHLWEPGAAMPDNRIDAIKEFHKAGIPTWASLEPVIDPEAALEIINVTHFWIDLFKVGKLNYPGRLPPEFRQQVEGIDWAKFARDVVALLDELGKPYLIKDDLKAHL